MVLSSLFQPSSQTPESSCSDQSCASPGPSPIHRITMHRELGESISIFHWRFVQRFAFDTVEAGRRQDVESRWTLVDESTSGLFGSSSVEEPQSARGSERTFRRCDFGTIDQVRCCSRFCFSESRLRVWTCTRYSSRRTFARVRYSAMEYDSCVRLYFITYTNTDSTSPYTYASSSSSTPSFNFHTLLSTFPTRPHNVNNVMAHPPLTTSVSSRFKSWRNAN